MVFPMESDLLAVESDLLAVRTFNVIILRPVIVRLGSVSEVRH
jgi:hypothetical protein